MDLSAQGPEFYNLDGMVVLFNGVMGSRGMLIFRPSGQWEYTPCGSIIWDDCHQQVYRNHRGDALSEQDLKDRGIRPPSAEELQYGSHGVRWEDNFSSSIPCSDVPHRVITRLKAAPQGQAAVYLILYEDCYETGFGDGRFLYPKAAFWLEKDAVEEMARLDAEEGGSGQKENYRYYLKEIAISMDRTGKSIGADLNIEAYEHYSLEEILRLLPDKLWNR